MNQSSIRKFVSMRENSLVLPVVKTAIFFPILTMSWMIISMWIALYLRGINMPWDRIDEFIHMAMKLSAVVTIGALINMFGWSGRIIRVT